MRRGGGKSKGASYEREVCKQLSLWISRGLHEDIFWRSAMSGGRATVGFKSGKNHSSQVGDISLVSPLGSKLISAFAIEVKHYADLNFTGLLTGKGNLLKFWTEINEQASRYGKLPMMFARQNRLLPTVCLTHSGMNALDFPIHKTVIINRPHDLCIVLVDRFFEDCKPFV